MLTINRIFIMILLLSISGFVFSIIYLPLEKIAYKLTSARFMVYINTAALFSFVIPFYYINSLYDGSEMIFANYKTVVFANSTYNETLIAEIHAVLGSFINYIDVIWLLGVIIFTLFNGVNYVRLINIVKKNSFAIESDVWSEAYENLNRQNSLSNVFVVASNSIDIPCTVGLIKRYIVIPAFMINMFNVNEAEYILKHELCHAVRKDAPRKALIIALNCLNWFNPLFYLLKGNLSNWIEAACDEVVTQDLKGDERKRYAGLIIKVLEAEERFGSKRQYFVTGFNGSSIKNYKRRILRIMKGGEKKSVLGKVLVSTLAFASIFTSSVFAKGVDYPVNQVFSEKVSVASTDSFKEVGEENYSVVSDSQIDFDSIDFTTGNYKEFTGVNSETVSYKVIYRDGTTTDDLSVEIEPNHLHNIVDTVLSEHFKYSDGSCKTTYYEGKKCTVCGALWQGDVISTHTYANCPH